MVDQVDQYQTLVFVLFKGDDLAGPKTESQDNHCLAGVDQGPERSNLHLFEAGWQNQAELMFVGARADLLLDRVERDLVLTFVLPELDQVFVAQLGNFVALHVI